MFLERNIAGLNITRASQMVQVSGQCNSNSARFHSRIWYITIDEHNVYWHEYMLVFNILIMFLFFSRTNGEIRSK